MNEDMLPQEVYRPYMRGMEFRAIVDEGYNSTDLSWDRQFSPEAFRMIMFLKIGDRTLGVLDTRPLGDGRLMIETRWMSDEK